MKKARITIAHRTRNYFVIGERMGHYTVLGKLCGYTRERAEEVLNKMCDSVHGPLRVAYSLAEVIHE